MTEAIFWLYTLNQAVNVDLTMPILAQRDVDHFPAAR
jgi:hypothetical protein